MKISNILNKFLQASSLLICSNIIMGLTMLLVYFLGPNTWLTEMLIYGPIFSILIVLVRDQFTFSYIVSCILAILHGFAHKYYPFLDSNIGVNKNIDVWQDQIMHLGQIIIFTYIFYRYSNRLMQNMYLSLIIGNLINVIVGFYCWGKSCHEFYVWISLLPALSSGLHFAIGTLCHTDILTASFGFLLQGTSSILTFFLFKSSDEILKLFALCRFFELYFIVPHYVGYFNSRYLICKDKENSNNKIFQILGIFKIPTIKNYLKKNN